MDFFHAKSIGILTLKLNQYDFRLIVKPYWHFTAAGKQLLPFMTVRQTVMDGRRQRTANSPPDKPKSPRTPLTGAHGLFFMQNQLVS